MSRTYRESQLFCLRLEAALTGLWVHVATARRKMVIIACRNKLRAPMPYRVRVTPCPSLPTYFATCIIFGYECWPDKSTATSPCTSLSSLGRAFGAKISVLFISCSCAKQEVVLAMTKLPFTPCAFCVASGPALDRFGWKRGLLQDGAVYTWGSMTVSKSFSPRQLGATC